MTRGVDTTAGQSRLSDQEAVANGYSRLLWGRRSLSYPVTLLAGALALILGIYVFGSTLAGVYLHYSPVPFYDQWDGYIGTYIAFQNHPWAALWAPLNEHRQVLARLVFIPDIRWFGGLDLLSIAVDILLCLLTVLLFLRILRRCSERHLATDLFLTGLVFACGFSWIQSENFTRGFQIPFFAVCFFGLLSFHALAICQQRGGSIAWFGVSMVSGLAAALSMANGLLILPLVCVFAVLLGLRWTRVVVTAVIAAATWTAYLYHPAGVRGALAGDSPMVMLLHHPLRGIAFVLLYLGSPGWGLLGGNHPLEWQLEFALGLLVVAGIAAGFVLMLRGPARLRAPELWMMAVAAGASSAITAGGRVSLGLIAALMPRYTTQAFMAWIGLLLFFILNLRGDRRRVAFTLAALALVGVGIAQGEALRPDRLALFAERVSGLALRNDVFDEAYTKLIYPSRSALVSTAKLAQAEKLSIFAPRALGYIDVPPHPVASGACEGRVDSVRPTETAGEVVLEGWAFDRQHGDVPDGIAVIGGDGQTIGSGIFGKSRRDIRSRLGIKQKGTGWVAFANMSPDGYRVLARTDPGAYCTVGGVVTLSAAKRDAS